MPGRRIEGFPPGRGCTFTVTPDEGYGDHDPDGIFQVPRSEFPDPAVRVNFVAHSMGGLAIRAWLRATPDGDARVHRVVTIGSPHHGTWPAAHARSVPGQQMRLHGPWVRQLLAHEPPGRASAFVCWYSNGDNAVYPPAAATLEGADNRFVAGLAHVELAFDPLVLGDCLELLRKP